MRVAFNAHTGDEGDGRDVGLAEAVFWAGANCDDRRRHFQDVTPVVASPVLHQLDSFDRTNYGCSIDAEGVLTLTMTKTQETKTAILEAARQVLGSEGYAGLSTRAVAGAAGAPMSQIQYHFGSKEGMVVALFEHMNAELLERQHALFADNNLSLSEKWDLACDYLDDDLESGYVTVLQELLAAGWSTPEVGRVVADGLIGWRELLADLAREAQSQFGALGPFDPEDIAALVSAAFIGAEAFLLLGIEDERRPVRRSLRRFGEVIRTFENTSKSGSQQ